MEVLEFSLSPKNGGNIVGKELISIWLERKTILLPKLMSEELVFQVICRKKAKFGSLQPNVANFFLAILVIFHKRGKKC